MAHNRVLCGVRTSGMYRGHREVGGDQQSLSQAAIHGNMEVQIVGSANALSGTEGAAGSQYWQKDAQS